MIVMGYTINTDHSSVWERQANSEHSVRHYLKYQFLLLNTCFSFFKFVYAFTRNMTDLIVMKNRINYIQFS